MVAEIPNGLAKIKQHAALFARVEEKYGVPAQVLTAFWGLESDFGANFGKYNILSALATLAYDCRDSRFLSSTIAGLAAHHRTRRSTCSSMIGDWPLGGMQFTATEYLKNASFDGDGRRDLIHSVPDTALLPPTFW